MSATDRSIELPLVPLEDAVCFPGTALHLVVGEADLKSLVRELAAATDAGPRRLGVVLLRDAPEPGFGVRRAIHPEGCIARLVEADSRGDGRYDVTLEGERRFALIEEISGLTNPYRRARVRPLPDDRLDEADPAVSELREEILGLALGVASEMGDAFPVGSDELALLDGRGGIEPLVNGLAAELDLPAERKLSLLAAPLADRALEVAGILKSRQRVLDLLRPYRWDQPERADWN